jgi:hypothetical protein
MGDYGTNAIQAGDVLMLSTPDGGDINVENGIIEMTELYETMATLELLGGNDDDDGSESTEKLQWWGNEDEPKERKYRSKFQALLNGTPITSQKLVDLQAAAEEQLDALFVGGGFAESVSVEVALPSNKRVEVRALIKLLSGETVPVKVVGEP